MPPSVERMKYGIIYTLVLMSSREYHLRIKLIQISRSDWRLIGWIDSELVLTASWWGQSFASPFWFIGRGLFVYQVALLLLSLSRAV